VPLSERRQRERSAAFKAVGNADFQGLIALLSDPAAETRRQACKSLVAHVRVPPPQNHLVLPSGKRESPVPPEVAALREAVVEAVLPLLDSPGTLGPAAALLAECRTSAAPAVPKLRRLLAAGDPKVPATLDGHYVAAEALSWVLPPEEVPAAMLEASRAAPESAADFLCNGRVPFELAAPALAEILRKARDAEMLARMLNSIGSPCQFQPGAAELFAPYLDHPSPSVRRNSARGLGLLHEHAGAYLKKLESMERDDPEELVRMVARQAAGGVRYGLRVSGKTP
jgi:hypothetical protein